MPEKKEKLVTSRNLLSKSSIAIHSSSPLKVRERKLMNALLHNSMDNLSDVQVHTITNRELKDLMGYTDDDLRALKTSVTRLRTKGVKWDILDEKTGDDFGDVAFLAGMRLKNGVWEYEIPALLKNELHFPEFYGKINMRISKALQTTNGYILYELCSKARTLLMRNGVANTELFEVEKARMMFNAHAAYYEEFRMFNQKKLKPAIEEVNRVTDFTVTLRKRTEMRVVTHISFQIRLNENFKALNKGKSKSTIVFDEEVDAYLSSIGIARASIVEYGQEFDINYVKKQIALMESQIDTVVSPSRFLDKAIRNGWEKNKSKEDLQREIKAKKIAEAVAEQQAAEMEKQSQAIDEQEQNEHDFKVIRNVVLEYVESLEPDEHEAFVSKVKQGLPNAFLRKRKGNLWNSMTVIEVASMEIDDLDERLERERQKMLN